MPRPLRFLAVCLSTALIEVGWVASVRLIALHTVVAVIGVAMAMQAIAYFSLLSVVDDRKLVAAGIIGTGVGALAGMLIPLSTS